MFVKEFSGDEFVKRLIEIVELNLDNPKFSIEQLCREAGASRTQLHRKIKAATSLSTSHFIRKIRLEKARVLLEETDFNITEIAYRTGNSSPQNFSKYFIQEYGLSPSNYRKEFQLRNTPTGAAENAAADSGEVPPSDIKNTSRGMDTTRTREGKLLMPALTLLVLVLAGWGLVHKFLWNENTVDLAPSIAVIPFESYGKDTDNFLSEGVVEDILTYLTKFKDLKVISRTSTTQFKNTDKSIREIAEDLEVNYILEGSVRQNKTEIRITAQLIRATDDKHIWAHRYDRPRKNVMEIQAEVARNIAVALNQTISPSLQQELDQRPTQNIEAYNAVLRGRYLQRKRTKEGLYLSIEEFDTALKLDPSYSEAYAGKAASYHLLASLRYVLRREEAFRNLGERNALQAIKYDKTNGFAYGILGNIYADQFRWEESIAAFEIALDLSPNHAILNYWFSLILRATGDLERSLHYHRIAAELDPLYPVIQAGYIYTSLLAGKFDLADQIMEKASPIMGESFLFYTVKGNGLMRKGKYEAAIVYLDKALELNPEFRQPESDRIYCIGRLGRQQEVFDYVARLDTTLAIDCLRAAKAYISIDSIQRSVHFLERSAELGLVQDDLVIEPIYTPLHSHPAFLAILEDYNLNSYIQANSGPLRQD